MVTGGDGQADVERAEREPDGEVVDAERQPGDDQPPTALAVWRANDQTVAADSRTAAADGLGDGPGTSGEQQAGADPTGGVAQDARQAVAQREPDDRHSGLEQAEDDADLQPGTRAGSGDPDADRGGEVRLAEGHRNQDQGQHVFTLAPGRGAQPISAVPTEPGAQPMFALPAK
jgi:hypothetical protein